MRTRSVSIAIASRQDCNAVGIGHANRDGRAVRGELTELVVSEERQVRLAGAMVDHAEDAGVGVDVGRCPGGNDRGDLAVHEHVASRAHQAADRLASRVGGEHILAHPGRPAVSRLTGVDDRCERPAAEQSNLAGVCQRDDCRSVAVQQSRTV